MQGSRIRGLGCKMWGFWVEGSRTLGFKIRVSAREHPA